MDPRTRESNKSEPAEGRAPHSEADTVRHPVHITRTVALLHSLDNFQLPALPPFAQTVFQNHLKLLCFLPIRIKGR